MLFQRRQVKQRKYRASPKNLNRQQGVVIIVALFIVALVATMSYLMMARITRDTRRTTLIVRNAQADLYAQGSVIWAIDELRNHWEKQKPNQMIDAAPLSSPLNEVNGYEIKSTIYDLQTRFNLNNLSEKEDQENFKRLMKVVYPKLDEKNAQEILLAIVDWISAPKQDQPLDRYYATLMPPYRAAHRPMQTVGELRLVKGMNGELFEALRPYVAALPGQTLINIQGAPALIFMMLSPSMNLETANALVDVRRNTPFVTNETFGNLDIVKNHHLTLNKTTVASNYFLVETTVKIEKQQVLLYTLLERSTKDKKAQVIPLWQSKGTW